MDLYKGEKDMEMISLIVMIIAFVIVVIIDAAQKRAANRQKNE